MRRGALIVHERQRVPPPSLYVEIAEHSFELLETKVMFRNEKSNRFADYFRKKGRHLFIEFVAGGAYAPPLDRIRGGRGC